MHTASIAKGALMGKKEVIEQIVTGAVAEAATAAQLAEATARVEFVREILPDDD